MCREVWSAVPVLDLGCGQTGDPRRHCDVDGHEPEHRGKIVCVSRRRRMVRMCTQNR